MKFVRHSYSSVWNDEYVKRKWDEYLKEHLAGKAEFPYYFHHSYQNLIIESGGLVELDGWLEIHLQNICQTTSIEGLNLHDLKVEVVEVSEKELENYINNCRASKVEFLKGRKKYWFIKDERKK